LDSGLGPVAGICEHSNETSKFHKSARDLVTS